jgi:hypothetical protein
MRPSQSNTMRQCITYTLFLLCLTACARPGTPAEKVCRTWVESHLVFPGTARFSGQWSEVANEARSLWTVSGKVESKNALGSLLQSDYVCSVWWHAGRPPRVLDGKIYGQTIDRFQDRLSNAVQVTTPPP